MCAVIEPHGQQLVLEVLCFLARPTPEPVSGVNIGWETIFQNGTISAYQL